MNTPSSESMFRMESLTLGPAVLRSPLPKSTRVNNNSDPSLTDVIVLCTGCLLAYGCSIFVSCQTISIFNMALLGGRTHSVLCACSSFRWSKI